MGWPFQKTVTEPEADWIWPEISSPQPVAQTTEYSYPPGPYDGTKFFGGVSSMLDELDDLDYWMLRKRSARLFRINSYARGIIRRLVTAIVGSGLDVVPSPDEQTLGLQEDSLQEWAEIIGNRFALWAKSPRLCDIKGRRTFGALQRDIYREALIDGDCLVVLRQDPVTHLPRVQIISGNRVQSPPFEELDGKVVDGVRLDGNGAHIGFYVQKPATDVEHAFDYEYIPAYGPKTGRLQAWLVYGYDKREDGVRGEPLLSIAIQPLSEIDRYRDSAQRKAYVNSLIVGYIKSAGKTSSLPITGGAQRKKSVTAGENAGTENPVSMVEVLPGFFMERLQDGEEPVSYAISGADVNFGPFEAAIMVGLAWALEIPPEVLLLSFNKNYSASQAANNEWEVVTKRERGRLGEENNDHVYEDWFLSEVLIGKIEAVGYVEAVADAAQYDIQRAWVLTEWTGTVKPSTDPVKRANGFKSAVDEGWTTNQRAAREINGSDFFKNIRQLRKENELKLEAIRPILRAEKEFGAPAVARALGYLDALGEREKNVVDATA